ncbi:MAG TPA: hypothetical protein VGB85_30370 [Nannocystis sp.]|jgi:hypothetical protein
MARPNDTVDEAALAKEVEVYRRLGSRTSWAFVWFAAAVLFLIVFHRPQSWPGPVAEGRIAAQIVLWIAVFVAYSSNARRAERRGFILGKFGRTPAEFLAKPPAPEPPRDPPRS